MIDHPIKEEKTLFIVKPDGLQRSLVGEIIQRFERKGLKIAALKLVFPTKQMAEEHYSLLDYAWCEKVGGFIKKAYEENGLKFKFKSELEAGKNVKDKVTTYLSCGPVVVMVLQGAHAVEHVRKLLGSTDPLKSDIGTIRGDFTIESNLMANLFDRTVRNMAHASATVEEANREIDLWFKPEEIVSYNLAIDEILYDAAWEKVRSQLI